MQSMAIIDSVKASSDIYCVMSGEIVEVKHRIEEIRHEIIRFYYL